MLPSAEEPPRVFCFFDIPSARSNEQIKFVEKEKRLHLQNFEGHQIVEEAGYRGEHVLSKPPEKTQACMDRMHRISTKVSDRPVLYPNTVVYRQSRSTHFFVMKTNDLESARDHRCSGKK